MTATTAPSKYNKRITVQSLTEGQDDRGGPTQTAATYATRWAAVIPLGGGEQFTEGRERSTSRVRFELRSDAITRLIKPKMQVSWDDRTFNVLSAFDVREARREVHVLTEEVT